MRWRRTSGAKEIRRAAAGLAAEALGSQGVKDALNRAAVPVMAKFAAGSPQVLPSAPGDVAKKRAEEVFKLLGKGASIHSPIRTICW